MGVEFWVIYLFIFYKKDDILRKKKGTPSSKKGIDNNERIDLLTFLERTHEGMEEMG